VAPPRNRGAMPSTSSNHRPCRYPVVIRWFSLRVYVTGVAITCPAARWPLPAARARLQPDPVIRTGQRIFDPLFVRFHADHLLREPADAIAHAGLELMQQHRSKWGIAELLEARKPE